MGVAIVPWLQRVNSAVWSTKTLSETGCRQPFEDTLCCGWEIVEERNTSGSLDDLKKIRLAPKFKKYAVEDLLVLASWLVARPS
jgi:hypothetical protein